MQVGKIKVWNQGSGWGFIEGNDGEDYSQGYASKKSLGGGVILTMIHDIDYLYWIFGNPHSLFSISGKFSDLKISSEDYCSGIICFKKNIFAELHLDFFHLENILQY